MTWLYCILKTELAQIWKYNNLFNHAGLIWNRPSPERIHIFWVHWAAGDHVRVWVTDDNGLIWNYMIIWNAVWKLITACWKNPKLQIKSMNNLCWGEIMIHNYTTGQYEFFFLGSNIHLGHICTANSPSVTVCQSAEYDKRVANISLFVYIGLLGLHPNSGQVPEVENKQLSLWDLCLLELYRKNNN